MQKKSTSLYVLLGLGREGFSTYTYLRALHPNAQFLGFDDKKVEFEVEKWQKVTKIDQNIQFFHDKSSFFAALTLASQSNLSAPPKQPDGGKVVVFKSPGISPAHEIAHSLMQAEWAQRVEWNTNTNLFFELLAKYDSNQLMTIGVTGTKGKSTTTALIHHVLTHAGLPAFLGGNIGRPPLDMLEEVLAKLEERPAPAQRVYVVLELSSHQLSDLRFSPRMAVIQEIVPEHLDYYPDFEAYIAAKSQIARYQHPDDLVIFNIDYKIPTQLAELSGGRHRSYTTAGSQTEIEQLVPLAQLPLKGEHNLLNIMPSLLIARELNLEPDLVREAIRSFQPLPHRMELVPSTDEVTYYNDSLSTTPEAAMAAISSFETGRVILLAGGYDRHLDYTALGEAIIQAKVKLVVLFPTTGTRIKQAVLTAADKLKTPAPTLIDAEDMATAVASTRAAAELGDVILLSPASASYNMYRDYQERGDAFKREVEGK